MKLSRLLLTVFFSCCLTIRVAYSILDEFHIRTTVETDPVIAELITTYSDFPYISHIIQPLIYNITSSTDNHATNSTDDSTAPKTMRQLAVMTIMDNFKKKLSRTETFINTLNDMSEAELANALLLFGIKYFDTNSTSPQRDSIIGKIATHFAVNLTPDYEYYPKILSPMFENQTSYT